MHSPVLKAFFPSWYTSIRGQPECWKVMGVECPVRGSSNSRSSNPRKTPPKWSGSAKELKSSHEFCFYGDFSENDLSGIQGREKRIGVGIRMRYDRQ